MTILLGKKYSQIYKDSSYIPLILKRQYLNFNGMSYGEFPTVEYDPSIVDTFEFECDVFIASSDSFQTLASSETLSDFLRVTNISTTPVLAISFGGIENGILINVQENTRHKIKFSYTDSTYTASVDVDGVFQGTLQLIGWQGMTKRFSFFGYLGGIGQYLQGYGFDVKFSQPSNAVTYPNSPSWPIANGFTLGATTPNVNDPSGNTDMDLFNVLEGDWTAELP